MIAEAALGLRVAGAMVGAFAGLDLPGVGTALLAAVVATGVAGYSGSGGPVPSLVEAGGELLLGLVLGAALAAPFRGLGAGAVEGARTLGVPEDLCKAALLAGAAGWAAAGGFEHLVVAVAGLGDPFGSRPLGEGGLAAWLTASGRAAVLGLWMGLAPALAFRVASEGFLALTLAPGWPGAGASPLARAVRGGLLLVFLSLWIPALGGSASAALSLGLARATGVR